MRPIPAEAGSGFCRAITLESVSLFPLRALDAASPSMALDAMPTRPALLISITDNQGCTGWGEVWANFPARSNLHKAHLIEDMVIPKLNGFAFVEPREAGLYLRKALSVYSLHIGQEKVFEHILAGIDTALWDLALRSAGRSFSDHMQIAPNARCYASSINRDELEAKLAEHGRRGQRHFKLKLGFGDREDFAFVERAAQHCPAGGRMMVDSNQSWDPQRARKMLARIEPFDLMFAEEPIPANSPRRDWEDLARSTTIPLAAGENVYGLNGFLAMADAGVRFLQPDVAKWGGISGAIALAKALPDEVQLWPHFMGTAVGQIAALSVSAAVGDSSACEMDVNSNPLRTELCGDVLQTRDGRVRLPSNPGLVPPPRSESLARFIDDVRS